MFFEQLPQQLVNGIILGSIYALLALGYTMVYGIIKLINFAHGDIYMIGAFVGYYAINSLKMNFWIALVFTYKVDAANQGKENSCFYDTPPSLFKRKTLMIDKECSKQSTNEIEGKYSNKAFDFPRDRIEISSYAGNQSNK